MNTLFIPVLLVLKIFLSNGCIVTLVVSLHTGDIDRVVIDKSLVGKLTGENPSHGTSDQQQPISSLSGFSFEQLSLTIRLLQ